MENKKLLDTTLLTILNQRIVTLFQNGGVFTFDELEAMLTDAKAMRTALKVPEIGTYLSVGRTGSSVPAEVNDGATFAPTLVFGSGDSQVMLSVNFNFWDIAESGIFLLTGANGWEAKHCYLAKTDWVKTYLENQKTTTQDIENLFS